MTEQEKFPIADIQNNNGIKKRIIDLINFEGTELSDECGRTDFLGRLQYILNDLANKQKSEWQLKINEPIEYCPYCGKYIKTKVNG